MFMENKNYLPFFQCGFRIKHSCLDAQIYLENYIQISLRKQKVLLIVFFDIQKAFDSSSHTSILFNLLHKGIKGKMFKWLHDFLSNRTFRVRIGRDYSDDFNINSGVPQGAVLSPLLFAILLSNPPSIPDVHTEMFADDLSLFSVADDIETATIRLQNAINTYNKWLKDIGLLLNPLKTKLMLFTRKKISNPPIIKLNNIIIPFTTTHKFLGLNFDSSFLTRKSTLII